MFTTSSRSSSSSAIGNDNSNASNRFKTVRTVLRQSSRQSSRQRSSLSDVTTDDVDDTNESGMDLMMTTNEESDSTGSFEDYAEEELIEIMRGKYNCTATTRTTTDTGVREEKIDKKFERMSETVNGVDITTKTKVFTVARKISRLRMTKVDGGKIARAMNVVIVPNEEFNPKAPMLGIDVLNFGSGKNVLIGVDYHPLLLIDGDDVLARMQRRVQRDLAQKYAIKLNKTEPSEKFYKDTKGYFSEEMFFARPVDQTCFDIIITENDYDKDKDNDGRIKSRCVVVELMKEFLVAYLEILDAHERAYAMQEKTEEERKKDKHRFLEKVSKHDKWQMQMDPSIKMFSRWYGEKLSKEYAEEILFPGAKMKISDESILT